MTQAIATVSTAGYTLVVTFILLKLIDMAMGLRVSNDEEREGLDVTLHGERIE